MEIQNLLDMASKPYIIRIAQSVDEVLEDGCLTDKGVEKLLEKKNLFFNIWGLAYQDVKHINFSKLSEEGLNKLVFSSSTIFPDASKLPSFFQPDKVLENVKSNFRRFDCEDDGVCMALIDNPTQCSLHSEFADAKIEFVDMSAAEDETHFHLEGVLENVCGKSGGYAKNARFLVYTINWKKRFETHLKALKDILRRVRDGQKIQVVSVSNQLVDEAHRGTKLEKEICAVVEKLKTHSCEVVDSEVFFKHEFAPVCCPLMKSQANEDFFEYSFNTVDWFGIKVQSFIPEFASSNGFKVEYKGGVSWAIPVVAYFYAVCSCMKKGLTFDEFAQVCKENINTNVLKVKIVRLEDVVNCFKREEFK